MTSGGRLEMAVGVILIILAAAAGLSYPWLNKEVIGEPTVLNSEGDAGTALVVYHAGKTGFHEHVTAAFADGLVSKGWRVEITTASAQAPADLSGYQLLVLGGPTYWFSPNRPIRRYLSRLGDLGGKPTASIITSMGSGARSRAVMETDIQRANGELVESLLLYTLRPNEDLYGINDAFEIANQAAGNIPRPAN
jgi:flavorubredoxin